MAKTDSLAYLRMLELIANVTTIRYLNYNIKIIFFQKLFVFCRNYSAPTDDIFS